MAVDSHLCIKPYANVFSVGDVTYCVDEATGKSLPMTATVALREANCVAQNIKHMLAKKSLCVYRPSNPGFVIPLGGKYAIFETHRFPSRSNSSHQLSVTLQHFESAGQASHRSQVRFLRQTFVHLDVCA